MYVVSLSQVLNSNMYMYNSHTLKQRLSKHMMQGLLVHFAKGEAEYNGASALTVIYSNVVQCHGNHFLKSEKWGSKSGCRGSIHDGILNNTEGTIYACTIHVHSYAKYTSSHGTCQVKIFLTIAKRIRKDDRT